MRLAASRPLAARATRVAALAACGTSAAVVWFRRADVGRSFQLAQHRTPLLAGRGLSSLRKPDTAMSAWQAAPAFHLGTGAVQRSAKIFAGFNGLGFLVSLITGSHLHLDLLGTGAFVAAAAATIGPDVRSKISAAAVIIWGVRLTSFLFYRALQLGHDGRLDEVLSSFTGISAFWIISFLWGLITALPHTLGASAAMRPRMRIGALAAVAVYLVGFIFESLADLQKWQFKQDPLNQGKFCHLGVWSLSQHPNYFGNLCIWTGILMLNAPSLMGPIPVGKLRASAFFSAIMQRRRFILGALSPLFLALLFYGQSTGFIANSAELAMKKYGADPAYQRYIDEVPLIVPRILPGSTK